tara:strand:- start:210 stop:977 length:768 start_codon:yes stop_codon:yes gene_type:complete
MLKLQLNDEEPFEYPGRVVDQMPILISDGRVPISFAMSMKRRLEALAGSNDNIRHVGVHNYLFTGDGMFYHPDGRVKVAIGPQCMRELTPESHLRQGALVLPDGMYDIIEGEELTKAQVEKYKADLERYSRSRNLLKFTKQDPFLLALAQGDQYLLNEYAHAMLHIAKKRWNEDRAITVCLDSPEQDTATGRLWLLGGCINNVSYVSGNGILDAHYGCLCGVAPEALVASEEETFVPISYTVPEGRYGTFGLSSL